MDFGALYDFLFNTYAGIGCLVGIGLVEDRLLKSSLHVRAITAFESRRAQLFSCALLFSSRQFSRTLKPYN